jgi:hypothetical protein
LPATLQAASIVQNGGFEIADLDPWYQDNDLSPGTGEDWNVTSTESHSGQFSATNVGNKEIRQNFGATATATITEFSFWIKHPGGSAFFVRKLLLLRRTEHWPQPARNTTEWQFFNITIGSRPARI